MALFVLSLYYCFSLVDLFAYRYYLKSWAASTTLECLLYSQIYSESHLYYPTIISLAVSQAIIKFIKSQGGPVSLIYLFFFTLVVTAPKVKLY